MPPKVRERPQPMPLSEAIEKIQAQPKAKFDETVEVAINLGIDPRRGDQMVRGAATLPHGTGKNIRVAVFATGALAEAAKEAGAEIVGAEDLIERISESGGSGLDFDKCVATPDMMPRISKIARILGPRGLMPNPKLGTVTTDIGAAVAATKRGRVEFRADKGGIVHAGIGKRSFSNEALIENISAVVNSIVSLRPKGIRGAHAGGYVLKASLSTTMGRGVPVSVQSLLQVALTGKMS